MKWAAGRNGKGFVLIELLAVIAIIAVLLGLGYSIYKGARASARIAVAENNLKQVGTAFELYFRKWGAYPPEGSDLAYVLKPYVQNPGVFANPLKDETQPGQSLSDLYIEPSVGDIDRPNVYVTCFPSDDGSTVVVLKTGGIVERRDGLSFNPNDPDSIIAALTNPQGTAGGSSGGDTGGGTGGDTGGSSGGDTGGGTGGDTGGSSGGDAPPAIEGDVNLNPNNKDDFEFEMDGFDANGNPMKVTRDDLLASNGKFTYQGTASQIRFRPKGNGNQNGIILNGKPYRLSNSNTYLIVVLRDPTTGELYQIVVKIYNRKQKGNAMGQWWMSLKTPPGPTVELYIVEPGPAGSGDKLIKVNPD